MIIPFPFEEMKQDLALSMLDEYDRGFNDAFAAIAGGLDAALEKAREIPQAKPLIEGLDSAVYVVKGLKEELDKVRNTEPETTGEKSDG
jgi:hypothetical protein